MSSCERVADERDLRRLAERASLRAYVEATILLCLRDRAAEPSRPERDAAAQDPARGLELLPGRVETLERQVEGLAARVQDLERALRQATPPDDDQVIQDPDAAWIQKNREVLRRYPESFVAINTNLGVVAHATTQEAFATELDRFTEEEKQDLLIIHTSMYF